MLQRLPFHLAEGEQRGVRQAHAPATAVCPATAALHITRDVIIPHTGDVAAFVAADRKMQRKHKDKIREQCKSMNIGTTHNGKTLKR